MKRRFLLSLLITGVLVSANACSGDFDSGLDGRLAVWDTHTDGLGFYEAGDYTAAFQKWMPLAELEMSDGR